MLLKHFEFDKHFKDSRVQPNKRFSKNLPKSIWCIPEALISKFSSTKVKIIRPVMIIKISDISSTTLNANPNDFGG